MNFPYKNSIDEWLIFYNVTRCYSYGEYCHSFAIAAGDIIKYQSFVWCATAMRVRFVHVRIRFTAMADMRHDFCHFQLPRTSLFMVRNIKCGYSFAYLGRAEHVETKFERIWRSFLVCIKITYGRGSPFTWRCLVWSLASSVFMT